MAARKEEGEYGDYCSLDKSFRQGKDTFTEENETVPTKSTRSKTSFHQSFSGARPKTITYPGTKGTKQDAVGDPKTEEDSTLSQQFPVKKAWESVKLNVRFNNRNISHIDETPDIHPCILQFAMDNQIVKKSILARLRSKIKSLSKSEVPETIEVEMSAEMELQDIIDRIDTSLKDKVIEHLQFDNEKKLNVSLDKLDSISKDLIIEGLVGIYILNTTHGVKVSLVGTKGDVDALMDMLSPSEEEGKARTSIYWDQQRLCYVERLLFDIDTVQYLDAMHFKRYLSNKCKRVKFCELAEDNKIIELVASIQEDVDLAREALREFLQKVVKQNISVSPKVLDFFKGTNVYLHLQKKLQNVPAYLQVTEEAVIWTDDEKHLEKAKETVLNCYEDKTVKGELEQQRDEIEKIIEESKQKIKVYEGEDDDDDETHVIFLKQESEKAKKVIDLLKEEDDKEEEDENEWFEDELPFQEYFIKYSMSAKIGDEIKKAVPGVRIQFCINSMSVKITADSKKDCEDACRELNAIIRNLKSVEIKGLPEGMEELLLRTHISQYVANQLKLKFLLFLKEGDVIRCVGKKLHDAEKMKKEIETKCFGITRIKEEFLETEYGKQFLNDHADKVCKMHPDADDLRQNASSLCYTKDLALEMSRLSEKCSLLISYSKRCNSFTSRFLMSFGQDILHKIEEKYHVKVDFQNGNLVFTGNFEDGEKASIELEKTVQRDILFFQNGERHKSILESEEGKTSINDITKGERCCWSMTYQIDNKLGPLENVMKNGVQHYMSWIPKDRGSTVSIVQADFKMAEFDVLVVPVDNRMCGENIISQDGSLVDYCQLMDISNQEPLYLGFYNWNKSCKIFGSKDLVLISTHKTNTAQNKQTVETLKEVSLQHSFMEICKTAYAEKKQNIGFALPSDMSRKHLMHVISAFLEVSGSYYDDKGPDKKPHLYICVKRDMKSVAKDVDVFISSTVERKQTKRIVSTAAEGIFDRPATSVHVTEKSMFDVKTECLVVAVAKNLDLSKGFLSNKLLQEAGQEEMMYEKNKLSKKRLESGEFVVIEPGKLRKKGFKKLILCCLKPWHFSRPCLKVLQQLVTNCLIAADEYGCKSVAFPALGTGNLSYPPRDVAKVMFDGVEAYMAESMIGQIDSVYISSIDKPIHKILDQMEKDRRSANAGSNKSNAGDDEILTANDTRIRYAVVKDDFLQKKPLGEYVEVHIYPSKKGSVGSVKHFDEKLDTRQLTIESGPTVEDFKNAVRRMVDICEKRYITSIYVFCSTEFGISVGEQAESIINTVYNLLTTEEDPSCHYNYLSNVTIVTKDEPGFFNIRQRLVKEKRNWLSSWFGVGSPREWKVETQMRPQCSLTVKLIGADKEGVDAAKQAIQKYLSSMSHREGMDSSEQDIDRVCAEVNPGIVKYLLKSQENYNRWKQMVENEFKVKIIEEEEKTGNQMKIVGSFERIQEMEEYLENDFPDDPAGQKQLQMEECHYGKDDDPVEMSFPISSTEKEILMKVFAEEIHELSNTSILGMSSHDEAWNIRCKRDKEAHVKAKFCFFKKKLSQMSVKQVQLDLNESMDVAKSVCHKQCPDNMAYCVDEKKKEIKIFGLNVKDVNDLEMKINREVDEAYMCNTFDKKKGKKVFKFGALDVYIYQTDILKTEVDCIVSPSNKKLENAGGLSKCIAEAAHIQYTKECEDSVRKDGEVKVSQCRATGSGSLKFQKIINVNCMLNQQMKENNKLKQIQSSVENCLQEADSLGMKSIALPFICSGGSGTDITKCAQQYITALNVLGNNLKHLREVHFVDKYSDSVQDVCKVFDEFFEDQIKSVHAVQKWAFHCGALYICHGEVNVSAKPGITVYHDKKSNDKQTLKELGLDQNFFQRKEIRNLQMTGVVILPQRNTHVVVAKLPMSKSKEFEKETRIAMQNILQKAAEYGMVCLALSLPKLQAGTQTELCCKAFSDQIVDFFVDNKTKLKEIFWNETEEGVFKQMKSILKRKTSETKVDVHIIDIETAV